MTENKNDQVLEILSTFLEEIKSDQFTFYEMVEALKERSFGLLLFLLALPNVFLLTIIPGFSFIFGTVLIFLSIQMILRLEKAWVPRFMREKVFSKSQLQAVLRFFKPYLIRIEKVLKPRWPQLSSILLERFLGIVCLIHSIFIALPIPLGNFLCGLSITFLALGMIAKDGIFMFIGYSLSVIIFLFFFNAFHFMLQLTQNFSL